MYERHSRDARINRYIQATHQPRCIHVAIPYADIRPRQGLSDDPRRDTRHIETERGHPLCNPRVIVNAVDLRTALARLEQTPGRGTPTYLAVEHEYARILRNAGAKDKAAQVEAEAKTMNANLRQPQCNGCTISVESFR